MARMIVRKVKVTSDDWYYNCVTPFGVLKSNRWDVSVFDQARTEIKTLRSKDEEVEIVFFKPRCPRPSKYEGLRNLFSPRRNHIAYKDLAKEYEQRGLKPVDPYSLAVFNERNRTFVDKHHNVTIWRDEADKKYRRPPLWNSLHFYFYGDRRCVRLEETRWDGYWESLDGESWFAGVRK